MPIFCVLIIFSAITASAEIYSWTDEKGVKHYSTNRPEHSEDVKTSDEIRHNAQEAKAREQEHEKWMNQKNRGEKIRTLKTTRRTKVGQNDEDQSEVNSVNTNQKKTKKTVVYVKSSRYIHKHIKYVKRESPPKVRTAAKRERIKSQKASSSKSSKRK
jgi:hypothetical protein